MKTARAIILLVLILVMQGCCTVVKNISKEYDLQTEPDKAVIFGELVHIPSDIYFFLLLEIKDLDTKKVFQVRRGWYDFGFVKKDPFFIFCIKPGKYSAEALGFEKRGTWKMYSSNFEVAEYTLVNLGTFVADYSHGGPIVALGLKDTFEELEQKVKKEYPNLANYDIKRVRLDFK